jgi:hypothetical protein
MVKIGITKRTVNDRIKDLNTSLPESFECAFYIKHINYKSIEKELHQIFNNKRINNRREFFWGHPLDYINKFSYYSNIIKVKIPLKREGRPRKHLTSEMNFLLNKIEDLEEKLNETDEQINKLAFHRKIAGLTTIGAAIGGTAAYIYKDELEEMKHNIREFFNNNIVSDCIWIA